MDARGVNDIEVVSVGYKGDGARAVFEHAKRVIPGWQAEPGAGDLIVTLVEGDDMADDDPIRVPSANAGWFVRVWLKVPDEWLTPLRAPPPAEGVSEPLDPHARAGGNPHPERGPNEHAAD